MIKAYNETWVDNLENRSILATWHTQKKLTTAQFGSALNLFPSPLYQPNFFVKIGLFLFSMVVINATWGFLYISIFEPFLQLRAAYEVLCFIYAIGLLFLLEYLIKKNNYYRSGTDNALLYSALSFLLFSLFSLSDFEWQNWVYCGIAVIVLIPALIRYGDPLIALAIFVNLLAIWYIWMTKSALGKAVLPFVIMLISAAIYFLTHWWKKNSETSYYTDAQDITLTLALLTFYLGGNYFVVREGNAILNNLADSVQVNLAFLFYFFTFVVPVIYIIWGLRWKDRKLVIIGVISAVISVLTFLHYFSTIPGEWESVIGGILLILVAILTIRFLKIPKNGITSESDDDENPRNFEALIISQITQTGNSNQEGSALGGGNFGGGGSGSTY